MYSLLYDSSEEVQEIQNINFQNDLQSSDLLNEVQQCQSVQSSWDTKVRQALAPVAAFDPRVYGLCRPEEQKQFFNSKSGVWQVIPEPNAFQSLIEEPLDEIAAADAVKMQMGERGVDIRPHLYDNKTKSYLLLDSGAMISAFPPERVSKTPGPFSKITTESPPCPLVSSFSQN